MIALPFKHSCVRLKTIQFNFRPYNAFKYLTAVAFCKSGSKLNYFKIKSSSVYVEWKVNCSFFIPK